MDAEPEFDLNAYLARIGYHGPRTPSLGTLRGVLSAHVASIPFESFDVLLGRPIRLDPAGLQAKLVTARRGGYCFEHASLLQAALQALGFAPTAHASRVLLFEPRHESARQHMFLTVTLDGAGYVLDPGFGPFASSRPIPMDGTAVPAEAPTHRLVRAGDDWFLFVRRGPEEVTGWVSTMEIEHPVDFVMMNHYIATHPNSFFTHNILASAVIPSGRVNIMNQDATILGEGTAEPHPVPDRAALRSLVRQHFGFDLPELETMRVDGVPGWA